MTDGQAAELNVGDTVQAVMHGRVVTCEVVAVARFYLEGQVWIQVRKAGLTPKGRRHRTVARLPRHLAPVKRRRPDKSLTPNVYADWLDERGEYRAAALLREAFPLPDPA